MSDKTGAVAAILMVVVFHDFAHVEGQLEDIHTGNSHPRFPYLSGCYISSSRLTSTWLRLRLRLRLLSMLGHVTAFQKKNYRCL